jgi:bifunctional non-homologous end joining protein LigD
MLAKSGTKKGRKTKELVWLYLNADVLTSIPAFTARPCAPPFSHPDWIFEIKWDGFRSLAHVEHGRCKLISRNGNEFKSFRSLNDSLGTQLKHSVVIDGEVVCLGDDGKSRFYDLLFRHGEPRFMAFDLLWCDGQDLRYSALTERKQRLRSILPPSSEHVLYCDHVERDGDSLFRLACDNDLKVWLQNPGLAPTYRSTRSG